MWRPKKCLSPAAFLLLLTLVTHVVPCTSASAERRGSLHTTTPSPQLFAIGGGEGAQAGAKYATSKAFFLHGGARGGGEGYVAQRVREGYELPRQLKVKNENPKQAEKFWDVFTYYDALDDFRPVLSRFSGMSHLV
jgi:hypothetical protein